MSIKVRFRVLPLGLTRFLFLSAFAARSQTMANPSPLDIVRAAATNGNPATESALARLLMNGQAHSPEALRLLKDAEGDIGLAKAVLTANRMSPTPTINPQDSPEVLKLKQQYFQAVDRYNKIKASVAEKEASEAVKLCEDAVLQSNVDSMLLLAYWCDNGTGMPTNLARAVDLNKKAAELGEPVAMDNLGIKYAKGRYVTRDMVEAVKWFEKAIAAGNYAAHSNLADILLDGGLDRKDDGYPKDPRRAYALGRGLELASKEGSPSYQWGAAIVQRARQSLDPDQLMAAETEADKIRQQLISHQAATTAPVINLKNSAAITKSQWREAFGKSQPAFAAAGVVQMQKEQFLKLCGEPSKTQTVGDKVFWYYPCKDGEIQLELYAGNLLGGIVAGRVNDY